jgi:hypothetical protein
MRQPTIKTIQYEIEVLNRQIDAKIITGRPYRKYALRHKMLLNQLRNLKSREGHNPFTFFGRMAGALATFVF